MAYIKPIDSKKAFKLRFNMLVGYNNKGEAIYASKTINYYNGNAYDITNYDKVLETGKQFMNMLGPTDGNIYLDKDEGIYE